MLELSNKAEGEQIDRAKLEDLLKQKFFYDMSFSIYGGKVLWSTSGAANKWGDRIQF